MRLVIVESPYAGVDAAAIERNVAYARAALADCLRRGEAPFASHLLYTQPGVLRDQVAAERELGIAAGLAWGAAAECHVFYTDLGWSPGMVAAKTYCIKDGRPIEERSLGVYSFGPPAPTSWRIPIPPVVDALAEATAHEALRNDMLLALEHLAGERLDASAAGMARVEAAVRAVLAKHIRDEPLPRFVLTLDPIGKMIHIGFPEDEEG